MRQGRGYLVHMLDEGVLQYPDVAPQVAASQPGESSPTACAGVQHTPFMTLVYGEVMVDGAPAPVGTVVEAVTPRGEVAGCFQVRTSGYFGLMQVYGADPEGDIPGFLQEEQVSWRVNGQPVAAAPDFRWADDRDARRVILGLGGGPAVEAWSIYVPLVVNWHGEVVAPRPVQRAQPVYLPLVTK